MNDELHKLQIAVEELSILNDLAVAASTTLEVEKMLDIIVHKSIKALHAEQGAIQLITEQSDAPLKTLIRQMDSENQLLRYKVGINITGWVLKYQKPLVIDDLSSDLRFHTTETERKEIRSVLCVPIQFRAHLFGVLMVVNRMNNGRFTEDDQRLLSIIASQSGQLIYNLQMQQAELEKQRLRQELDMAQKIQKSLLPKCHPVSESFDITICYEPAETVAGDYYDYFRLNDHLTGIVIADVSGHGTSAALVMTMVKGVLHSVCKSYRSPAQMLGDVNTILCGILPPQIFITMVFMQLDPRSLQLRFASAGHNPLLFYHGAGRTCEFLECRGLALGVKRDISYIEREVKMSPGDFLLAYTDGVIEAAASSHEIFGEERLLETVRMAMEEEASDLVCRIRQTVCDFSGRTSHEDDMAMIGIKMKNKEANRDHQPVKE
ncbi:SpoIIE family protein phosphatase [bacterium]|nr:SpoIIE family protein phosphatase [bacterium]